MNPFKRLQTGRYVRHLTDATAPDQAVLEAKQELLAMGPSVIRSVLDSLQGASARDAALEVLERLVTSDTLPTYIDALRSPVPAVADAAAHALAKAHGYDPTELLPLFGDARVSKARLESILVAHVSRVQAKTLLQLLPDMTKDARGSVFRLIEKSADNSLVSEAVRLAVHTEWWLRLHMARLLSNLPSTDSTTAVIKLLKDENASVRLEAVRSLRTLNAPEAMPALCARLRDPDIKVQTAAIEALIGMGDVNAVPHLLEYLKDENEYVRRGAVEVLNQVVTVEAIKDLVESLRDADWWVRVRAADALGTLGGDRVVEATIALLDDGDDFVRRYAVEILNTVPDERAVEPLIHALDDVDWWVRERAVDALAKTKDARATEPLVRMLSREPRSVPLVAKALVAIGDARAVEPLCRIAGSENPDVRREALHALTQFAKLELASDLRETLVSTLEAAGVVTERTRMRPMEVRGGYGPEAGRIAEAPATPQTPTGHDSATTSPSGLHRAPQHNYQKLEPGTVLIDRFRVLERIGGGGFGTVYLVEDVVVREEMVLKILAAHLSLDEVMIRRFVQELKLTRRITHRNVIRIHDLIDLDGAHGISMEYFAGRDLGQLMRSAGPLPPERVLKIAAQVLDGLSAAHELGIVHRDIKPANILVGLDDLTKIVDFGLASVGHTTRSRLTASGILVGTPEYISPEQITGGEVDGRTDLYSLGVVLYELLSGVAPFGGETAVNVLFQHLESTVAPLAEKVEGLPPGLSDLVALAMSRNPDERPASAAQMRASLDVML